MNSYRMAILAVSTLTLCGCGSHASSPNAASSGDSWAMKTNIDQMTDQKTVYAVDTAQASITSSFGTTYTPRLALACVGPSKNEAGIFIDLGDTVIDGDPGNNRYTVNIRLDGNKEATWNVSASSDGKGYFFNDPAKFLGAASNAKHMLLGFTTAPDSQQDVVDFDISGTNDALKKLPCHA